MNRVVFQSGNPKGSSRTGKSSPLRNRTKRKCELEGVPPKAERSATFVANDGEEENTLIGPPEIPLWLLVQYLHHHLASNTDEMMLDDKHIYPDFATLSLGMNK
jgi:hypothetical protein